MAEVGIVIVTYQSEAVIGACLDSVARTGAEVVVIDNASRDRTAEVGRGCGARVIANVENRGFAGGVNQGVQLLDTPYVLLVNPDAVLETGIEPLIARLREPGVGAVGGLLVGDDGRPQRGFSVRRFPTATALVFEILLINRVWPSNPVNWKYRCFDLSLGEAKPVDQPAGAFLMFSRAAWKQCGGFDEAFYPVWFEDVDFCLRLKGAGFAIWIEPASRAVHHGGHAVKSLSYEQSRIYWYGSLLRYAARHFEPAKYRWVCAALVLGSVVRFVGELFQRRTISNSVIYGRVARMAAKSLLGPQCAESEEVR
jgi:N-acetylglucosaminyl-diphospho-decaprenol L-rhamnosyltransferase